MRTGGRASGRTSAPVRALGAIVRSEQWWSYKVPPIIAVAALSVGRHGPVAPRVMGELVLLLASVAGIAAFGHLVNDWADIEVDAQAGKANLFARRRPTVRVGLVGGALAVGLLPWVILAHGPAGPTVVAAEVVLLILYSVPPVRLKGRGTWGVVADALYAYVVPFVLAALALGGAADVAPSVVVALVSWSLLVGLRSIIWHQVGDAEADRRGGVRTLAIRLGPGRTVRLVASVLLPLEVASFVVLLVVAPMAWLPWAVLGLVAWRAFQVLVLWTEPVSWRALRDPRERVRILGFELLNHVMERCLPVVTLVALAWSSPWWWVAVVLYVVIVPNVIRSFLVDDLWVLPDAGERLAFAWRARRAGAALVRRRRAEAALGPQPLVDSGRRFVFVVCGPASHVRTLATAVEHLRPVTDAEIWVITDARRNEEPIQPDGVTRVVDVSTPEALDDHQASIWLKTSVHRHLPAGVWCYLDSDIIAVGPGVEGVFDELRGPVAFASDVTIRENSVDRFSPWAMTCSCSGMDDEHSCGHLREQLSVRFGLDVAGDWLHWNGGVFVFGEESAEFLDLWHERAVASFAWPEWKTRDQGALISTVWSLGLVDLPRISATYNFIADLGNHDLCLDPGRGWAHHPSGPWFNARLLHLYTSPLEDPDWDLSRDVEQVVLRRTSVRLYRYRRGELKAAVLRRASDIRYRVRDWVRGLRLPPFPEKGKQYFVRMQLRGRHLAVLLFTRPVRRAPVRLLREVRGRLRAEPADGRG